MPRYIAIPYIYPLHCLVITTSSISRPTSIRTLQLSFFDLRTHLHSKKLIDPLNQDSVSRLIT